MLKHVVFLKFKPDTGENLKSEMESRLRALPAVISEIKSYELGRDVIQSERSFDFAIIGTFEDLESLNKYSIHPEHQKVLKLIAGICSSIKSVDFEI